MNTEQTWPFTITTEALLDLFNSTSESFICWAIANHVNNPVGFRFTTEECFHTFQTAYPEAFLLGSCANLIPDWLTEQTKADVLARIGLPLDEDDDLYTRMGRREILKYLIETYGNKELTFVFTRVQPRTFSRIM